MAKDEHLRILTRGVKVWNTWRKNNPGIRPDLSHAILREKTLNQIDFSDGDLFGADLSHARLRRANLHKTHLREAKLVDANLIQANLRGAHFREAKLRDAKLMGADLSFATLVMADLRGANLTGSSIYGVSAWEITLNSKTKQTGLIISKAGDNLITVDNLEVAQLVYLLLNNKKIRDVIYTVTTKVVLILGRFTRQRKIVLDAIREALRDRGYLPVIFDFAGLESRNISETILTLASMARFVIADITDPRSIPQELMGIIPQLPSVPVQPLLRSGAKQYGMFDDFLDFRSVLAPYRYDNLEQLLTSLDEKIIEPAIARAAAIESRRLRRKAR